MKIRIFSSCLQFFFRIDDAPLEHADRTKFDVTCFLRRNQTALGSLVAAGVYSFPELLLQGGMASYRWLLASSFLT